MEQHQLERNARKVREMELETPPCPCPPFPCPPSCPCPPYRLLVGQVMVGVMVMVMVGVMSFHKICDLIG